MSQRPPEPGEPLTEGERWAIELLARGCTDSAIARTLHVGQRTLTRRIQAASVKLGGRSRVHTVVLAVLGGHVTPDVTHERRSA